jgi:hypothetical protein
VSCSDPPRGPDGKISNWNYAIYPYYPFDTKNKFSSDKDHFCYNFDREILSKISGQGITSQECNTKWRNFICSPDAPLAQDPANPNKKVDYCTTGILPTTCSWVDVLEIACRPPIVARPPPSSVLHGDQPHVVIAKPPLNNLPPVYSAPPSIHASTAKPINIEVPGFVPEISQCKDDSCWAAGAAIMKSWKDQVKVPYTEEQIAKIADNKLNSNFYQEKLASEKGGPINFRETTQLANALGMVSAPFPISRSDVFDTISNLLQKNGALWVGIASNPGYQHSIILTSMVGDGTFDNTILYGVDPGVDRGQDPIYKETFQSFVNDLEEAYRTGTDRSLIYYFP